MHLYAGRTRLTHFVQYLIEFYSRTETDSDVRSDRFVKPNVSDKRLKSVIIA